MGENSTSANRKIVLQEHRTDRERGGDSASNRSNGDDGTARDTRTKLEGSAERVNHQH